MCGSRCVGGRCRKKEELGVHAATLCNNAEKLWTRRVNALHCSSHFEWIRSFFQTADVRSLQKEASKGPNSPEDGKMVCRVVGRAAGWSLRAKSAVFLWGSGLVWAG